jgi:hypothetical protein
LFPKSAGFEPFRAGTGVEVSLVGLRGITGVRNIWQALASPHLGRFIHDLSAGPSYRGEAEAARTTDAFDSRERDTAEGRRR